MNLLNTSSARERSHETQAVQMAAQQLLDAARAYGLVVTASLEARMPLAMGSYDAIFDVREAR